MKKIYFFLYILCLSLLVFGGCGETTTKSETTSTNVSEDTNVETASNSSVSEEVIASVEEVHEHEFVYTANDDFTHTKSCKTCDEVNEVEDCTFDVIDTENPMVCSICGFSHTHDEVLSAKDNEDGTHTLFCDTCKNEFVTEEHIIKDNENKEVCDSCSYERVLWEEEPIEPATMYVKSSLNIRMKPTKESDLVENLSTNSEVTIVAHVSEYNGEKCDYFRVSTGGYALGSFLSNEKVVIQQNITSTSWQPNPNQTFEYLKYGDNYYVDFGSFEVLYAEIIKVTGKTVEQLIADGIYKPNSWAGHWTCYGKTELIEIYEGQEHWGCPIYILIAPDGNIVEFAGYFGKTFEETRGKTSMECPVARYRVSTVHR